MDDEGETCKWLGETSVQEDAREREMRPLRYGEQPERQGLSNEITKRDHRLTDSSSSRSQASFVWQHRAATVNDAKETCRDGSEI